MHFNWRPLQFSKGQSAVRFSAYCHKTPMVRSLTGEHCRKFSTSDVTHESLVIPPWSADWAHDRYLSSHKGASRLWNDIENHEEQHNRHPNRVCALEVMLALPLELTMDENIELADRFARMSLTRRGYAFDLIVHDKLGNPHVHIIFTQRPALPTGWGPKQRRTNFWTDQMDIRADFANFANLCLAQTGELGRLDPRRYVERGLNLESVNKLGPTPANPETHRVYREKVARSEAVLQRNSALLLSSAEELVKLTGTTTSLITRSALEAQVRRWVKLPSEAEYRAYMNHVETCSSLVMSSRSRVSGEPHFRSSHQIELEHRLMASAQPLFDTDLPPDHETPSSGMDLIDLDDRTNSSERALRAIAGHNRLVLLSGFSGEDRERIKRKIRTRTVSDESGIVTLATRDAAAVLAGDNLSGQMTIGEFINTIRRRPESLPSQFIAWIDGAGLLEIWEMADLVEAVGRTRGRLVLLDDDARRQPIPARTAYTMLWEACGGITAGQFEHQDHEIVSHVSESMAAARTHEALARLAQTGMVFLEDSTRDAITRLAREFWTDPSRSLAIAPTRTSVDDLNRAIRAQGIRAGRIRGIERLPAHGERPAFGRGDRVITRESVAELRVRAGMLGTVTAANEPETGAIEVQFDELTTSVRFPSSMLGSLAPGFALGPRQSRSQIVDRVLFLATGHVDHAVAVTAFSRHRNQIRVVVDRSRFASVERLANCLTRKAPRWDRDTLHGQTVNWTDRSGLAAGESVDARPDVDSRAATSSISYIAGDHHNNRYLPHACAEQVGESLDPQRLLDDLVSVNGSVTVHEFESELAKHCDESATVRQSVDRLLDHENTVALVPDTPLSAISLLTTAGRLRLEDSIIATADRLRHRSLRTCLETNGLASVGGPNGDVLEDLLGGSAFALIDGPARSGKTETACSLARLLTKQGATNPVVVLDDDRAALVRHRLPGIVSILPSGDIDGTESTSCYIVDAAETVRAVEIDSLLRCAEQNGAAVVMFGDCRSEGYHPGACWRLLLDRFPARNLIHSGARFRPGDGDALPRFLPETIAIEEVSELVEAVRSRACGAQSSDEMIARAARAFLDDPSRAKIVLCATRAQAAAVNREICKAMRGRPGTVDTLLGDGSTIQIAKGDRVRVVNSHPDIGFQDNAIAEFVCSSRESILLDFDPFATGNPRHDGPRFVQARSDSIVLDHAFADTFENAIDFPGSRHLVFDQASRGQSIRRALLCGGEPRTIHVLAEEPVGFLSRQINTTGWADPLADLATVDRTAWQPRLEKLEPETWMQTTPFMSELGSKSGAQIGRRANEVGFVSRSGHEHALNASIQWIAAEEASDFCASLCGSPAFAEVGRPSHVNGSGAIKERSRHRDSLIQCFHGEGRRLVTEAIGTMRATSTDGLDRLAAVSREGDEQIALSLAVAFTEAASPEHVGHGLDVQAKILSMMEAIEKPDGSWFERAIKSADVIDAMVELWDRRDGSLHQGTDGASRPHAVRMIGAEAVGPDEMIARLFASQSASSGFLESEIIRTLGEALTGGLVKQPDELRQARIAHLTAMSQTRSSSGEFGSHEGDGGILRPLFTAHEMRALSRETTALPKSVPAIAVQHRRQIARNGRALANAMIDAGRIPSPGISTPKQGGLSW